MSAASWSVPAMWSKSRSTSTLFAPVQCKPLAFNSLLRSSTLNPLPLFKISAVSFTELGSGWSAFLRRAAGMPSFRLHCLSWCSIFVRATPSRPCTLRRLQNAHIHSRQPCFCTLQPSQQEHVWSLGQPACCSPAVKRRATFTTSGSSSLLSLAVAVAGDGTYACTTAIARSTVEVSAISAALLRRCIMDCRSAFS